MPIDPSIILGVKPIQLHQQDPLEMYGKSLALKGLMGQQELQGLQMQQTRQGIADDTATRDAYMQSGGDNATLRALLSKSGNYKAIQAFDKNQLETEAKRATIGKDTQTTATAKQKQTNDAVAAYRDQLANVKDPESMAQWVAAGYNDPVIGPLFQMSGTLEQAIAKIPKDPDGLMKYVQQNALGATKYIEMNKPHVTTQDIGGTSRIMSTPGLGGAPTVLDSTAKTLTPGEVQTDARVRSEGALSRGQAERHFQAGQNAPQYMETDAGLVALPKRLAPGQVPAGTPVMGPDGQPLGKPLKALPPAVNDAIIGNAQSLYTLDKAIKLIEGKNVDSAVGDKAATGWKGYLPQSVLNRVDPSGVDTRAEIADIGSLKIHDRSGAAVTISESPRLMPFIPNTTDHPGVAKRKLTRLKEEAERQQKGLAETYSKDQGYKPNPVGARAGAPAKPGPVKFLGFE